MQVEHGVHACAGMKPGISLLLSAALLLGVARSDLGNLAVDLGIVVDLY